MASGTYRALYTTALDRFFAICGSDLHEIFPDRHDEIRGTLDTSTGYCDIAENEYQLLIVDGLNGYTYDLATNSLDKIVNYTDMVYSVILVDGGAGYHVNDILFLAQPVNGVSAEVLVTAVTDTGKITNQGIAIRSKGRGYTIGDKTTTSSGVGKGAIVHVEQLIDGGFVAGNHCICIDGFFIVNEINTSRFHWSYLRDGQTWDALDYANAEGSADTILNILKTNNEIWLFGSKSIELWYDTGDTLNGQFSRVNQGFMDLGLAAEYSPSSLGNIMFFLGSNQQGHGIVFMATNYTPTRISTNAIEYIIGQMNKTVGIDDAIGYTYQEEGHYFYVLNFTKGQRTLVYDMSTKLWHERGWWNVKTATMERHRGELFAFWLGQNYVSDYQNTNLYKLDLDTYTDNGDEIRRIRTGGHVRSDRKRVFHQQFELDIERGVGLESGLGSNPSILLYSSDDGGKTWSNGRQMNIGKTGQYSIRARANRLGMSRDRVYRIMTSDPVKMIVVSARIDADIEFQRTGN